MPRRKPTKEEQIEQAWATLREHLGDSLPAFFAGRCETPVVLLVLGEIEGRKVLGCFSDQSASVVVGVLTRAYMMVGEESDINIWHHDDPRPDTGEDDDEDEAEPGDADEGDEGQSAG